MAASEVQFNELQVNNSSHTEGTIYLEQVNRCQKDGFSSMVHELAP